MKKRWTLAAAAVFWLAATSPAAPPGPGAVVQDLHDALLEAMKGADRLGYVGRYDLLEPVIRDVFDLRDIVRIAVGGHWDGFTAEERKTLTEAFSRLTVATYASRFDGYSGQTFTLDEVADMRRGRKLVRTRLVKPSGDAVRLDYLLQPQEDRWRIVNVIADGVSDLSLKRAEYTATLDAKGFAGLLEELEAKVRGYEGGAP